MAEFTMPSLGADMDEGTLVEWLVKEGDAVRKGDIVAVVDTTKSAIEVEVFEDGVIERFLVEPGTTVPVGTPLAVLEPAEGAEAAEAAAAAGGAAGAGREAAAAAAAEVGEASEAGEAVTVPAAVTAAATHPSPEVVTTPEPPVASPIVRHLAHEHGLDLRDILGTGPDGVISREDVDQAIAAARESSGPRVPAASAPAPMARARGERPPRVSASPLARRRASELGVDLALVPGTGPAGAVTVADVERASELPATTEPPPSSAAILAKGPHEGARSGPKVKIAVGETAAGTEIAGGEAAGGTEAAERKAAVKERAAAMRATIANLMARSKKEIPHYYLRTTVDFQAADDFVRRYNADKPVSERLLPAVLMLKAAALAVRKVPEVNGFFTDGAFHRSDSVHLGVAVSLRGGGLVAPAIHDADTLALPELMAKLKDLVARTRAGRLRGSEMSDPTITVTNLGEQGVEVVHGVIYPPQVALVGFGTVVQRPWAVEGMLTVRPVLTATLAADHRVSDGHRGGLYLAAVQSLLQRPEEL